MTPEETAQRSRVTALARTWIGTPYKHGARLRGVGADCTFISCVYEEAGLVPHIEIAPYTPQTHLHKAAGIYLETLLQYAREIGAPQPADIVMYRYGHDFSHGAIIVEPGWPHVVHGDMGARFVVEGIGNQGVFTLAEPGNRRSKCAKERKFFTLKRWEGA